MSLSFKDSLKNTSLLNTDEVFTPDDTGRYFYYTEYQDENFSTVDQSKKISVDQSQLSVMQEENSQYMPFEMFRYVDGIDLKSMTIRIHYENKNGEGDFCHPINVSYSNTKIRFAWLLDAGVTAITGKIKFMIIAEGENEHGDSYRWSTEPNGQFDVIESLSMNGIIKPDNSWYSEFTKMMMNHVTTAYNYANNAKEYSKTAAASADNAREYFLSAQNSATAAEQSNISAIQAKDDAQTAKADVDISKAVAQTAANNALNYSNESKRYMHEALGAANLPNHIDNIKSFVGYDEDYDVYGVEVDMIANTFTRLGNSVGKTAGADFDQARPFRRSRCNLSDDGMVNAYYGDPNYREDGSNGQVMVEQPSFYYRVEPLLLDGENIRKARYFVSGAPRDGFKLHPAFIQNGQVKDRIYVSAYEASLYNVSSDSYVFNDDKSINILKMENMSPEDKFQQFGFRSQILPDGSIRIITENITNTQNRLINGQISIPAGTYTLMIDRPVPFTVRTQNREISISPGSLSATATIPTDTTIDHIAFDTEMGVTLDMTFKLKLLSDQSVTADFTTDKLSSIANVKPISGRVHNLNRANARSLAHNRGVGWEQGLIQTLSASQLLMLIEYATFDMQTAIGIGNVSLIDDGSTNMAVPTGGTSSLGNASGAVTNTDGVQVVSYRGEENFWGNIWTWVDGINIYAFDEHKLYIADHGYANNTEVGYEAAGFTPAKTNGYISAFGYNNKFDWLFIPSETVGNNNLPVGDHYYQNATYNGWLSVPFGCKWNGGSAAGAFCWALDASSSFHDRTVGARLIYIPQSSVPDTRKSLQGQIGDIASLQTSTKSDLVSALNETVTTTARTNHTHVPKNITLGGSSVDDLDPIAMGFVNTAYSNKSFGLPPEAINIQYTRDGGNTWIDYPDDGVDLFKETRSKSYFLGWSNVNGAQTTGYWLRVTIEPIDRYCIFNSVYHWVNDQGNSLVFDLEVSSIGAKESFTKILSDCKLSGWPGANITYFNSGSFGGSSTQLNNRYKYRMTYKMTSVNTSSAASIIQSIQFYGPMIYNSPYGNVGNMLMYNAPYILGGEKLGSVIFPQNVRAASFDGILCDEKGRNIGNTIGDLTTLTTTAKNNLVSAINDTTTTLQNNIDIAKYASINMAIKMLCPNNEIILDDVGLPSAMVYIPKFKISDVITGGSNNTHPAFIVNGKEVDGVYISKYQNIIQNGRAYSLPREDPTISINFDTACQACEAKGSGWHLMTNAEWAAIALWCRKNQCMPNGNNNYGKDVNENTYKSIPTYKDGDGKTCRIATGTGPLTWSHDGTLNGIWDLNGNVWEWIGGYRTNEGEIQIIPNNDAATHIDQSATSTNWMAIKTDGSLVAPGTTGSLKWDYTADPGTVNIGKSFRLATMIQYRQSNAEPYGAQTFQNLTTDSEVTAPELLNALTIFPADVEDYGGDYVYMRNVGERLAFRGGPWNGGVKAGIFAFNGYYPRSSTSTSVGFRSAYIPNI